MMTHSLPLLQRPAARQVFIIVLLSLSGMLLVTYTVLGFYAYQKQQETAVIFLKDVIDDLNHNIDNGETDYLHANLMQLPTIENFTIFVFAPTGRTVTITKHPEVGAELPQWSLIERGDDYLVESLGGFEAWQNLDRGYRMYIKVEYQPLLQNFAHPIYGLPLLFVLCFLLLTLIQLRKRYEAWDQLIGYAEGLQQVGTAGYHSLQVVNNVANPEIQLFANILNRFAYRTYQSTQRSEELITLHQTLVDNSPSPLFVVNRKGRLLYFNSRFAHVFGTAFDKNVTYLLSDFLAGVDRATQQVLLTMGESAIVATLSVTNLQRDMYFDLRLNPYYNRFGALQGFSGSLEIVTHYHEQLQQAWLNKQQQNDKIASFDKVWAVLGHELRTPLSGMIGMIDLLNEDKTGLDTEQQETLTTLQHSSHTMLQLLNDMLDVAKLNAGKLQTNLSNVDVLQLVRQITELMIGNVRRQHISIYLYLDPALPRYIESDDGRLRQILLNLLSNAIKFTKQGYVAVLVQRLSHDDPIVQAKANSNHQSDDWIRFTVKDTGIGITDQDQKKLFSYFNQANDSISQQFGGTGLGLAISNNFSQLLGGFIHLESHVGQGSEFQVYLPLVKYSIQPVFSIRINKLDILLIVISPYDVQQHIIPIMNALEIPATVITQIDDSMVDKINQLTLGGLKPVFLIDDVGYDKSLFAKIDLFHDAIKLIASMDNERSIDGNILQDFDALVAKPVLINVLLAEIGRLYQEKYTPNASKSSRLPAQLAFKQFLQRQQLDGNQTVARVNPQPINSNVESESSAATAPSLLKPVLHQAVGKKTILVAEDNPVNQKIAHKHLTKLGYPVILANDGEQALELLSQHRDDIGVVLMDCRMPVLDGIEATRRIRASKDSIPIIALTANDSDDDKQACLEAGMNAFLTKPLNKNNIQTTLSRYMIK